MTPACGSSSRPRVLEFITHLALGGAERVAFTLMRGLREHFDFAVFAAGGVAGDEMGRSMRHELEEMGIPLHTGTRVPMKFGGIVLAGKRAASVARQFRPDLIHLHTEIPEATYAAMVALQPDLRRLPLVRTIHNTFFWHHWRRLGRWCDRRMPPARIVTVSQDAMEAFSRLRAESGAAPAPGAPVVIYNGVAAPDTLRPFDRAPGNPLRVLFAGRFEPQKGADLLPRIVAEVHPPQGQTCELVLHGDGGCESLLRTLARQPPPGWFVKVLRPVPDLIRRMPAFDLVIMPSRFEGLGLIAIEAALIGLPVVATNTPGLRETLPPDHPWKADPGDPGSFARVLQKMIENPGAWPDVARRAQHFARERFDLVRMCESYRRLFGAISAGAQQD